MNREILKILSNKYYDYLFEDKIRTPIFDKIETHNFINNHPDGPVYECAKCKVIIFFEYDVYYNYSEFKEILTCDQEVIKKIIL